MKTKSFSLALVAASLLFGGCFVAPASDPYYGEAAPPPLPSVVELDNGPYYHYRDYHYRYEGDSWRYSRHAEGPWRELPRSHWPHEVRQHGGERGGGEHGGGRFEHEHEHEYERR